MLPSQEERTQHFRHVVDRYLAFANEHPDYCFASTLEGLTDKYNTSFLHSLFDFLGEPLTGRLRRLATASAVRQKLKDWNEERHTRRIRRIENGSVVIETREYAFTRASPG